MKRATASLLPLLLIAACNRSPHSSTGAAASSARTEVPEIVPTDAGTVSLQKFDTTLGFLRAKNARDYAITAPNGIDEGRFVEVGGIEQWITIRGEDRNNPVVLFLHGGPGDATNPWGYIAFRSWLKQFTVVQWDQRGAGRTFGKNADASPETITVARLVQDGIELAESLRKSLRKDKIVLVGHSWGSILGVLMAKVQAGAFLRVRRHRTGRRSGADLRRGVRRPPEKGAGARRSAGDSGAQGGGTSALLRTAGATPSSASGRTSSKAPTSSSAPCSVSRSALPAHGPRYQRLDRRAESQRRAPGPRDQRARRESARRRLRDSGFRDSRRRGLHHADKPGPLLHRLDPRADAKHSSRSRGAATSRSS